MTLDQYQAWALTLCGPVTRGNLFYAVAGLTGEAGEFADAVKKAQFHNKPPTEFEARVIQALELGDVLWMLAQASDSIGYSLEEIAQMNREKLTKRHGSTYNPKHYTGGK